jgi:hypothetical protein
MVLGSNEHGLNRVNPFFFCCTTETALPLGRLHATTYLYNGTSTGTAARVVVCRTGRTPRSRRFRQLPHRSGPIRSAHGFGQEPANARHRRVLLDGDAHGDVPPLIRPGPHTPSVQACLYKLDLYSSQPLPSPRLGYATVIQTGLLGS